jgi:hypothetical protein
MWDYVPILIGLCGASVVVGICWKVKKDSVSLVKLLRIAVCAVFVLSLISVRYVPPKFGSALIWFWIALFVLYLVITRLGERLKKVYKEFRSDPQRYLISLLRRIVESMKPNVEALAPKGSWNDMSISKPVSPGLRHIGLAIGALIFALFFCVITWVFFFSEEENLRPLVWTFRYSLLFSVVIITFCYLLVLVIFAALQWFRIMTLPIRFGRSLQCLADWSGYGAALASCLVLVLPVLFLFADKKLNSANRAFFSLSLLFDAASVGALGGLVIGCFVGLFHLIDSRNFLYNSILPSALFGIVDLGFLYGCFDLRPTVLLDRYFESHLSEDDNICNGVMDVKSILNECLSWSCERMYVVLHQCDPSMGRLIDSVDVIYFRAVLICLVFCVLWRLVRTIRCAKGGLSEGVVSSA